MYIVSVCKEPHLIDAIKEAMTDAKMRGGPQATRNPFMVKMLHMALNDDTHEPKARAQIKSSLEAASSFDAVLEAADRLCEWEAAAERAAESAVGRTRTSTFRQRCDRADAAFVSWCARLYLRCAPGVRTVDMPFQHTRAGIDATEPMAQRAAH